MRFLMSEVPLYVLGGRRGISGVAEAASKRRGTTEKVEQTFLESHRQNVALTVVGAILAVSRDGGGGGGIVRRLGARDASSRPPLGGSDFGAQR